MASSYDLPVSVLQEKFTYDPDTGLFEWKPGHKWGFHGQAFTHLDRNGYYSVLISYKKGRYRVYAHRAAYALTYGEWPAGHIDHIDRNRQNNRINNLRVATPQVNGANGSIPHNSTSGIRGVMFDTAKQKWKAYMTVHGVRLHLGSFDTKEQAIAARDGAENLTFR